MIGLQLEGISNLHSSDSGVLSRHGGVALVVGLCKRSFPTFIALIPGCLLDMALIGWQLEVISNLHSSDSVILSGMVVLLWWLDYTRGHFQPS